MGNLSRRILEHLADKRSIPGTIARVLIALLLFSLLIWWVWNIPSTKVQHYYEPPISFEDRR